MFRKTLIAVGLAMAGMSAAEAGIYISPMLAYQKLTGVVNNTSSSYYELNPRLAIGIGDVLANAFYLGIEAIGDITSMPTGSTGGSNSTLRTTYSFGGSLIPGVQLDDVTLAYVRLGVQMAHFSNVIATKSGAIAGVGLSYAITPTWGVRGEFDYIWYNKMDSITSPRSTMGAIGVVYNVT